ncbi:M28 family metallopeptidase [Arenimonas sp.]|uniref:M28 family metallopeptidase n=1 Tax=Arenimonas sp. TaxID=1872635 RepID=UPI0039E6D0D5
MTRSLVWLAAALALTACSHASTIDTEHSMVSVNNQAGHAFGPEISAEDFAMHLKVLASDEFGGRGPGTPGEDKTVQYLRDQFQRLGLQPGNGDSYFQTVPMVETTVDQGASKLALTQGGARRELAFGSEAVAVSRQAKADMAVADSPLVFVGYGVNAPEVGWNDYAGLDVRGKTVVMLINDPGFHANDAALFEGRRMTYYGRWTYKFEEAARQGAAAALIIHDTAGAGYGWDVVKNSWSGTQHDLSANDDPAPRLPLQGWLTAEAATQLFAKAGLDLEAQRVAAGRRGFKAVALGDARFDASLHSTVKQSQSRNVIAKLPGTKYPDEAIVYMAHWDHLGVHPEEAGDNIYNGAIDNGTGVAGVLEIAEEFTVVKPKPERSIVFLLVTLEESGLLGSAYYAANPPIPLANTVAAINLDAMPVVGRTKDLIVIGLGNSEMDDLLRPIAQQQGRTLVEESAPEKGLFFRSDHFSFAKAGVPALYIKGGVDHREKGRDYGLSVIDDYTAKRYHKAGDQFDSSWDLRGIVDDLDAVFEVGKKLASSRDWPNYREGNAFRAVREKSREEAKK